MTTPAPDAWEIHYAWKYAVLDTQQVLDDLQAGQARAQRNLSKRWATPEAVECDARCAFAALQEIERVAGHLRWLVKQFAATSPAPLG